jgi:arylsulfatase
MAVYAAMIDNMDQNIGKLVDALKESGDIDNTLILFFSDNGGCHEPVHRGKKGAITGTPDSFDGYEHSWANASNTPFRWFKHWTHEGGSSTPFIAWYPKMIKPGIVDHQVAHIIDIMPTLCEITGAEYPEEYNGNLITPVEGKSMLPIFKGEIREGHETLYWEHMGNKAVRRGDWKLVSRYVFEEMKQMPWELYNLKEDRVELNDLSEDYPEMVKEMEKMWISWADSCNVMDFEQLINMRREKWGRTW